MYEFYNIRAKKLISQAADLRRDASNTGTPHYVKMMIRAAVELEKLAAEVELGFDPGGVALTGHQGELFGNSNHRH